MAQRGDGFQRHVTSTLDGPLIVLFEQDRTDEAGDGFLVWEDAHHLGAALDLAIEPFDWIGGVQLRAMGCREGHVSQHIGFGFIHEDGKLG